MADLFSEDDFAMMNVALERAAEAEEILGRAATAGIDVGELPTRLAEGMKSVRNIKGAFFPGRA